ncbi:MAG: hypothetical protein ACI9JN_000155 [Bacteroidia bacterium]|jgi:hypothetical protein
MGLFDAFKKKVVDKTEKVNPLYAKLDQAGFGIKNMQLLNKGGNVTVSGTVDDGAILEQINEFLSSLPSITNVSNDIEVGDISAQGQKCKVMTKGSNLNARAGASTTDDIVGRFAKDAEVLLVRRYNATWHQVRGVGIQDKEVEGYCHTDYLKAV